MQEFEEFDDLEELNGYDEMSVHFIFRNKYKENDVLSIKEMTDIFGTEKNKKQYEKYNGLRGSKITVINRFKRHSIIEKIDNTHYKIVKIRNKPINIRTLRMLNNKKEDEALYYLTVIFLKQLYNICDSNDNLDSINSNLLYNLGLINDNYNTIKFETNHVSEYYNIENELVYKFIQTTDSIMKYYIELCINTLNDYGAISSCINRKIIKKINNRNYTSWANNNENELIDKTIENTYIKHKENLNDDDFTFKKFYFNKNTPIAKNEIKNELLKHNIIKFYNNYQFNNISIELVEDMLKELSIKNKSITVLTKEMNDIFIEKILKSIKNKGDFSKKDCDNIKKLCKVSLNNASQYKLKEKIGIGCIYRFLDKDNNIIYVGKTINLERRLEQHFGKYGHLSKECYENVKKIEYIKIKKEINRSIEELYYINKYQPIFNIKDKNSGTTSIEIKERKWIEFKTL